MNDELDRGALVSSLKEWRTLEVIKNELIELYNKKNNEFNSRVAELNTYNHKYVSKPKPDYATRFKYIGISLGCIICIIACCLIIYGSIDVFKDILAFDGGEHGSSISQVVSTMVGTICLNIDFLASIMMVMLFFFSPVLAICGGFGILFFIFQFFLGIGDLISDIRYFNKAKKEFAKTEKYNCKWQNIYDKNQKLLPSVQAEWQREKQTLKNHQKNVDELLKEQYLSLGIPNGPARSLEASIYIYDYMDTSRASLLYAVNSYEREAAFRDMKKEMKKEIRKAKDEVILEVRITREKIEQGFNDMGRAIRKIDTVVKNNHWEDMETSHTMINQLGYISRYSSEAAHYAKSDYIFSVCEYLEKNR